MTELGTVAGVETDEPQQSPDLIYLKRILIHDEMVFKT